MTMTDPLADMLTRVRNAAMARHETVRIPNSKVKPNSYLSNSSESWLSTELWCRQKLDGVRSSHRNLDYKFETCRFIFKT